VKIRALDLSIRPRREEVVHGIGAGMDLIDARSGGGEGKRRKIPTVVTTTREGGTRDGDAVDGKCFAPMWP
jgi:hypothetical protein